MVRPGRVERPAITGHLRTACGRIGRGAKRLTGPVQRVIVVVMDSVGVGAMPDAADWGDAGSDTVGNTSRAVGGLRLPNMERLGLGNLTAVAGVLPRSPAGACGKMALAARGKDTMTGHWEIAGIVLDPPLRTYPEGFPAELIRRFEAAIGRQALGNKPASGTEIIAELGGEHMATGKPIVYTSADSVFQIAAHEDVIPVEELYRYCQIARELCRGEYLVGRVIARPFEGRPGAFRRTPRRHDYALEPPRPMLLDRLNEARIPVATVGKIADVFTGRGVGRSVPTRNNQDGMDAIARLLRDWPRGFIWANLVDFDMLYGHRNDPRGYAVALEALDRRIPDYEAALGPGDVLIFTADHGCDPTTPSTDHSREYVPLLVTGEPLRKGVQLETRPSLADLGATVAELLGAAPLPRGTSFAGDILAGGEPA